MNSNRFVLVDREEIASSIEGVDFGGRCHLIVRSPEAVLFWNGSLVLLPSRSPHARRGWLHYKTLQRGGRLSRAVIENHWQAIAAAFPDIGKPLHEAVRQRKTLIIDGGGPPLMPSRYYGPAAYAQWRHVEPRGFYNNDLLTKGER